MLAELALSVVLGRWCSTLGFANVIYFVPKLIYLFCLKQLCCYICSPLAFHFGTVVVCDTELYVMMILVFSFSH